MGILGDDHIDKTGRRFLKAIGVDHLTTIAKITNPWKEDYFLKTASQALAIDVKKTLFTTSQWSNLENLINQLKEEDDSLVSKAFSEIDTPISKCPSSYAYGVFQALPPGSRELLGLIKIKQEHFSQSFTFFSNMLKDLETGNARYEKEKIKTNLAEALKKLAELVENIKKSKNLGDNQKKPDSSQSEPPNQNPNDKENNPPKNDKKEPGPMPPEKTDPENDRSPNLSDNKNSQNQGLEKLRKSAIDKISQVMQEAQITDQDLATADRQWKSLISQSNNEEYINSEKIRLLALISQVKEERKNRDELSELVQRAEEEDNPTELKKIIEKIEKFRGEKSYNSLLERINAGRKRLAEQDSEGYEKTNEEMIKKELKDEKVEESELDAKTQQNLIKLRQGGLKQNEIDAIKDEVSNNIKLKSAEKELVKLLEGYQKNPSLENKNKLISFINSTNYFYQKVYQQKKDEIENLLKVNHISQKSSPLNNSSVKVVPYIIEGAVIGAIIVVTGIVIKERKSLNSLKLSSGRKYKSKQLNSQESIIEIKNLKKSYQGKLALQGISFSVKKGTIHGFIGLNGAGKTTTIKSLIGGIKTNSGKIYLAGKKKSEDEYANCKIGFMAEKFGFANDLTVEEFIYLVGRSRKVPFPQVKKRLQKSDLYSHRRKKCKELSVGWGKILLYFAAVIHEPAVLVLDEPTSGLDPFQRRILLKQLEQFKIKGGTVLISSHILSDLQKLVDSVTIINEGKIVYTGEKPVDLERMYYEKVFLKEREAEKEQQTWI